MHLNALLAFPNAGMRDCIPRVLSPGWSLLVLADVGVPHLKIMDAYESVTQRNDRIVLGAVDKGRQEDKVSAILELFKHWINGAQTNSRAAGSKNSALQELSREMASGRLAQKINAIRASVETFPDDDAGWMDQLSAIEESIRYMV